MNMTTAQTILKDLFGYDSFRGLQTEAIESVLNGNDCLVVMPTGGGKSLCYQIPAIMLPGTAIVVSPLIALMHDQVSALKENGVRAAALNSGTTKQEASTIYRSLQRGELDLLYLAPERLVMESTRELLRSCKINLIAIDESHCVCQWGHDFRKDYLRLSFLREEMPEVPRIALTATADERGRSEIKKQILLPDAKVLVNGFDRPNIHYAIHPKTDPIKQLIRYVKEEHPNQCGIVYRMTRSKVEETAEKLTDAGLNALPYHAGLPAETRRRYQERFLREDNLITVATIAFGMGIDKPNIRYVAHLDLPRNIESYYQETGRAGRDGKPADAWMVYGMHDVVQLYKWIKNSEGDEAFKRHEHGRLQSLLGLCESITCRRQLLLRYFGQSLEDPCGNCDVCLEAPQTWDATEPARKMLSCIYRTGQRFGAGHLIKVVRGQTDPRIESLGHDKLVTFGVGSDLDDSHWRSLLRQLLIKGFLRVDEEGYGVFELTPAATPLLRGDITLHLREDILVKSKKKQRAAAKKEKGSEHAELHTEDARLMQELKALRMKLAKENGVPAYIVFSDKTLSDMARRKPRTLSMMADIHGVGAAKLARYGALFTQVIESFAP